MPMQVSVCAPPHVWGYRLLTPASAVLGGSMQLAVNFYYRLESHSPPVGQKHSLRSLRVSVWFHGDAGQHGRRADLRTQKRRGDEEGTEDDPQEATKRGRERTPPRRRWPVRQADRP